MIPSYIRLAQRLELSLGPETRSQLSKDPRAAIEDLGVRVVAFENVWANEECGCDGVYFWEPRPTIAYLPTPGSRRENFTLLHELGHHLYRQNDDAISALGDLDDDEFQIAQENLCDAFAGRALIPDDVVNDVLEGRRPEARDLPKLFEVSIGSREVCAVRLAERMPCFGYVAFLDPINSTVRFASASPQCPYRWRRGSKLPTSHPVWQASKKVNGFRGQGEVIWDGGRKNLWLDALDDGPVVIAVFSEERYWKATGLNILSGTSSMARPPAMSGTCKHCGANTWGYRACDKCGDVTCKNCGRCGCGAKAVREMVCSRCGLLRAATLFSGGSTVCRDCL
jgi:Zn-dependent peptidase ImmA (M78 family)